MIYPVDSVIHLLNSRGQVCKIEDDLERKLVHVRLAELCLSNRYLCYCSRCLRRHRFVMSLFNSPNMGLGIFTKKTPSSENAILQAVSLETLLLRCRLYLV